MNTTFVSNQQNIGLAVRVVQEATIIAGLNITASLNKSTDFMQVGFEQNNHQQDYLAYVFLSPAAFRKMNAQANMRKKRITSVVFKNSVLFQRQDLNGTRVDNADIIESNIISVSVNGRRVSGLSEDEEVQNYFRPHSLNFKGKRKCVYWNFKAKGLPNAYISRRV